MSPTHLQTIRGLTEPTAVATFLQQLLFHPDEYFLGPLLDEPVVASLHNSHAHLVDLLRVLSFDTFEEFQSNGNPETKKFLSTAVEPPLSAVFTRKLQVLSVLSASASAGRGGAVALELISRMTGVSSRLDVEELVTDTITEGYLEGRICQTEGVVRVQSVVARYQRHPLQAASAALETLLKWKEQSVKAQVQALHEVAREEQRAAERKLQNDADCAKERKLVTMRCQEQLDAEERLFERQSRGRF